MGRSKLIRALAEAGFVNRAAEKLRVDPTTIPRRIRRLEDRPSLKLIERIRGGIVLTEAADDLVRVARAVETGVDDALSAPLQTPRVTGTVKLSGTDFMLDLLADALVDLQRRFPGLILDLKPTNDYLSLDRRETNVAIIAFDEIPDT